MTAETLQDRLSALDLSFVYYLTLRNVSETPETMTTLAAIVKLVPTNMTRAVDVMVRRNLLSRRRDEQDKRILWVSITEDGKKLLEEVERE